MTYERKTTGIRGTPELKAAIWDWYCQKAALGSARTLAQKLGISTGYVKFLIEHERARRKELA